MLLPSTHDFRSRILHGDAEFSAEGLIRLAGWHYELTAEEGTRLRYVLAKSGEADRERFLAALQDDASA